MNELLGFGAAAFSAGSAGALFPAIKANYRIEFARMAGGALIIPTVLGTWRMGTSIGWWAVPLYFLLGMLGNAMLARTTLDLLAARGLIWWVYVASFLSLLPAWALR